MQTNNSKLIIVCSNYAWTIFNFRMPLIAELRSHGYKVIVLTEFDGYEKKIATCVDGIYPLFLSRKGMNPFIDGLTILNLYYYLLKLRPDCLFAFSIKPVIYGSVVSRLLKVPCSATITGVGTGFVSRKWISYFIKKLYRVALKS